MLTRLMLVAALVAGAVLGYFLLAGGPYRASSPPPPGVQPAGPSVELGGDNLPLRQPGQAKTYVVLMNNVGGQFLFQPAGLRVLPGDTVTWLNLGDNHSTTAYAPPNAKAGGVAAPQRIPEGAQAWDSGILGIQDRGLTFSQTFEVAGTYDYFCFPHEFLGMVGRVVVDQPGGPAETAGSEGLSDEAAQTLQGLPSALIAGPRGVTFNWEAELNVVLLKTFQKDLAGAVDQAQRLVAGAAQLAPLLGSKAGAFQRALQGYLSLAQAQAGFGELSKQADELRELLAQARS